MARQQQKDYKFTPGTAGVGTVKIPGNYESSDILTILNATDQVFIYNFADPDLGAIVTFSKVFDADFPQSQDGVTTITLNTSTVTMSADDSLAIYIETEAQYIRPWPFGTDAVERMRVSTPQSLIDADFEYGLQNTKWQSLSLNNDVPSLYELPGSELTIDTAGYVTFLGTTLSNSTDTTCDFTNQTGLQAPNWVQDDYALIVDPHKANQPTATYITANAVSSNDITCTVTSTQLQASGGVAYLWSPANGLSAVNIANPVARPAGTTTYYVRVTDENNCVSKDSVTVHFTASGDVRGYQMPTAFTPNGDGLNDCFGVGKWGNVVNIDQFDIFNRWGQLVFKGGNANNCWDGSVNGKPQPSGSYVYKIIVTTSCGVFSQQGTVILIQ